MPESPWRRLAVPLRALLVAIGCLAGLPAVAEPVSFKLDPTHTFPAFEVSHLGFSLHRGRFNGSRGTLTLDRDRQSGVLEVTIDAASLDTGHAELEKVLRSDGFFDVERFPELRYQSSKLIFEGERLVAVEGALTLKGTTRPVRLTVDHFHCGRPLFQPNEVCGANATARLLRSEFGIDKYVSFGLGDEVKITIQVEAIADPVPQPN